MTTEVTTKSTQTYPIPNLVYDLVTIIHEKAKGLEAYDQYMQDAQDNQGVANLLQQIRQQDSQVIQQLWQQLQQVQSSTPAGSTGG